MKPFYEDKWVTIYNENCLDTMNSMKLNSVDLTVTSPPYDGLRDYKGYSFDFESIASGLYEITKQGGVVVWIVGDETKNFCESMTSFKQAIFFNHIGFNLLDTMIYYKQSYAPAYPTLRRYANQFEYMFVFSKGKPKTFNPIRVKKVMNHNGMIGFRKKDGGVHRKYVITDGDTKHASNVWEYAIKSDILGHPAIFPELLANDHIISWSNEGDLVFDPFVGSGTTLKMAKLNNRKSIGVDISEEYCHIAKERCSQEVMELSI